MAKNTKQLIINTYIRLLEESPSSHVTVKEISKACGINRNTFYYHFKDILSLIEEIFRQGTEQITSDYQTGSLTDRVRIALDYADQHRTAILNLYNSIGHVQFEKYLIKVCDFIAHEALDPFVESGDLAGEYAEFVIYFYKCSCVGLFIDWLHNDMEENIEANLNRFQAMEESILDKLL